MIYFTAHTLNCVCHCIRAMFRVLGMYNFATWSNKPALTKSVKWVHSFSVGNANTKECYQKIFWNWPQNWQRNCTKKFSWNFHCPHESTQFWFNIHFDRLTTIGNLVFLRLPWGSSSWPRGGNNNCKQTKLIVTARKPLMNFEFKLLPDLSEFLSFHATFPLQ